MFRVLGPLEIEVDGVTRRVSGARARALLTALLLRANSVVPTSSLVDVLWGERPPRDAANALHQVVGRLRSQLGELGRSLVTRPPGYVLVVDESSVDAERFTVGYRVARGLSDSDPARAAALLDEALAWWRGPAYGEFAEGFALAAAAGLEELRVAALEDRAALLLSCGQTAEAVAAARELASRWPLRERPVELLMRALRADGRAGEALEAFRGYREVLAEELGLDPGPALRDIEADVLRDDAPPALRTATRRPEVAAPRASPERVAPALPWRPGALLGRERELRLLQGCLQKERLVTLVGPGGVGKTRLALEAAHELARDRTVWWADLTTVRVDRLVDTLADTTATDLPRTADPVGTLCTTLRAHRGLLCLDNAEHVLDALAPILERLHDAAPDITVVTTTRERLALADEHVHTVTPFPVSGSTLEDNPAVQLFVSRAPDLEPEGLDGGDLAVVVELCRRLDGLPLAIELGAACSSTFGLAELAARLGQRLDLLAGGRRTAAARHRTLRAVVDWSYALLGEDEARLLERLVVFPGTFSLGAAEAVCADDQLPPSSVGPLLARLVEQSLVQAGAGHFSLLETLRAYAEELLDESRRDALRARHAHVTAQRLTTLRRRLLAPRHDAPVAAAADLDALRPDLHAAWAYAAEHDRTLAVRLAGDVMEYAYYSQRLDLLEWGREVAAWDPTDAVSPLLPDALAAGAAACWAVGSMREAAELAARGVAAAGGDTSPGAAHAINQRACLAMFAGRSEEAAALFARAASLHEAAGQPVRALLCEISVWQATSYRRGEDGANEAAARMGDLLARARTLGHPSALAWAHYVHGEAVADLAVDRALADYAAAIGASSAVGNRLFVMLARTSAVRLTARHAPVAEALEELEQVVTQWEDLGSEATQWWVLFNLVVLMVRAGSDRDGAVLAGAALAAGARHPSFPRDEAVLEDTLRQLRDRLGDEATDTALAEGATLPFATSVTWARRAVRAAGPRAARVPEPR
ncbi:BTAD domain-containing putative transcriptional regulator [Actinomycetospora lutea]|uniref:AfsR/SARP family transcriptional regulator n=1 Tax=Actinomycetospora lutea TaxID=663604 RepID=UPI0023653DD6|nr:BTAD domain-containing putative transcriptional regulator [Actinomycetospora lutea]MDD7942917.1 BTAD domain-containing putative transcriptional regulator [Actinomycetospora lutea]